MADLSYATKSSSVFKWVRGMLEVFLIFFRQECRI